MLMYETFYVVGLSAEFTVMSMLVKLRGIIIESAILFYVAVKTL